MAIGAFGPRPDRLVAVWLLVGAALALVVMSRARAAGSAWSSTVVRRTGGLAAVAIIAALLVHLRSSRIETQNARFASGGISVAATVYAPKSPGPHPAVVFVHGSAPFKRGFYSVWAERLAERGIVSVVADKRGVGGTGGEFEKNNNSSLANLQLLAGDVVAALTFASTLPQVDTARLGLFGISQAGWVGPLAALRSPRARFMVIVSGPTVSVHEENVWSDLRGDHGTARVSLAEAERVIDTVTVGGVDPRPRLAALSIPGLWLFGLGDNSIPSRKSIAVLDNLRSAGRRFEARGFPGAGHGLVISDGGLLPRIAPSSWDSIDAWLLRERILK